MTSLETTYAIAGCVERKFVDCAPLRALLTDIHSAQSLKHPYTWESKYQNTLDLRPDAHSYDTVILGTLRVNNIPKLLDELLGPDMVLTHTQIRCSRPGPSYMDWHRDTYIHAGLKPVGNFPPAHKLIYYPTLGRQPERKLKMIVGSHRRNFDSLSDDMNGCSGMPRKDYLSSDDSFVIFNTSMLHGVIPDSHQDGSIRIIYSFLRRHQYERSLSDISVHKEQVELYENEVLKCV